MIKNISSFYRPEYQWLGRSLSNYISQNPKAKEAESLTEARRLVFGMKSKSFTCKCRQPNCKRDKTGEPHC